MPVERNHEPTPEQLRDRIPEDDLTVTFSRSHGPGGQNVNKTSTRVTVAMDLRAADQLSADEKRRIRRKLAGYINKEGVLRVTASEFRTQRANRREATERLYELLADALRRRRPRKKTKVPQRARERRLSEKKRRGERKDARKPVSGSDT